MKSSSFYFGLYMALIGGNWIAYHMVLPIRIAHHILLTAFLVYFLWRRGLPDTPMLLPVGAMAAALALAGVNSIDRRMALEYAWHWLTNWLLFLYLIEALRDGQGDTYMNAMFAAGGLLAASCIVEWLLSMGTARPSGMFGVINLTGGYLAALIVPALGYILTTKGQPRGWLISFVVVASAAILLNQSRGPLLSLAVALTAFGLLSFKMRAIYKAIWGTSLLGFCAVAVIWFTTAPQHINGDVIRLDLWRAGGEMLMDYPTGVGAGLFPQAYHQLSTSEDRFTGAHNYYINLAAELGAPGLAASAAFFLVALYFLIGQQRTMRGNAVLAALLGISAHMVFDNYPAQNWTFLLSLYLAYLLYEVRILNRPVPVLVSRLVIYLLIVYSLLFARWDLAQIHYENALRDKDLTEMETAILFDPQNRLYGLEAERLTNPTIIISSNYAITNFARISY